MTTRSSRLRAVGATALIAITSSTMLSGPAEALPPPPASVSVWKIPDAKVNSAGLAQIRPKYAFTIAANDYLGDEYDPIEVDKATLTVKRGSKVVRDKVATATLPSGTFTVTTKVRYRLRAVALAGVTSYGDEISYPTVLQSNPQTDWKLASRTQTLKVGKKGAASATTPTPEVAEHGWLATAAQTSPRRAKSKTLGAFVEPSKTSVRGNVQISAPSVLTVRKGSTLVYQGTDSVRLPPGTYAISTRTSYRHRVIGTKDIKVIADGQKLTGNNGYLMKCENVTTTPTGENTGNFTADCTVTATSDPEGAGPEIPYAGYEYERVLATFEGVSGTYVDVETPGDPDFRDFTIQGDESSTARGFTTSESFEPNAFTPDRDVTDTFDVYRYGPVKTSLQKQTLKVLPAK